MSFSGRTPESLLPRSDSKNPATTCKGITTSGRPCRRALGTSSAGVISAASQSHSQATALYCWQHKDQADNDIAKQREQSIKRSPLRQKCSLDTLIDRVGSINLDDGVLLPPRKALRSSRMSGSRGGFSTKRRNSPHLEWHGQQQSPLVTVPEEATTHEGSPRKTSKSGYGYGQSNVEFSWSCCLRADYNDRDSRPARPTHRSRHSYQHYRNPPQMMNQVEKQTANTSGHQVPKASSQRATPSQTPPTSDTQALLALIPKSLNPQITSTILAELSRPVSSRDEAGYIYIFWLTPDSDTSPDDETASSLLDDNEEDRSPSHPDRRDAAIQRYASVHRNSQTASSLPKRTLMLKIGRAQNVHRRMSQWTKQCGQNITLIRYYPHQRSSVLDLPQKVPCVARVERLIHLELSDMRAVRGKCARCEREHREWFEIEASRAGLRGVDEVVRRWVAWAERWGAANCNSGSGNCDTSDAREVSAEQEDSERKIHERAWHAADRIRDDARQDVDGGQGNDRGGYF